MEMTKITVLTPTYNRASLLPNLFESLCKQINFGFEWLIIDDGSEDDTEIVVKSFKTNSFKIRYEKKINGGKHSAINYAMQFIDSEWTFIVDSDDQLTVDAIHLALNYCSKYNTNKNISAIAFLRRYPDGKINVSVNKANEYIGNYIEDRIKHQIIGDMAEIYKTECLKEFPFPEYDGERFVGEDVVWIPIAQKYNMVFVNNAIYISNYLEDGLTANRRKNSVNSPNSWFLISKIYLRLGKLPFKTFFKFLLYEYVYGLIANYPFSKILNESNHKVMTILITPIALFYYLKWRKYKEEV